MATFADATRAPGINRSEKGLRVLAAKGYFAIYKMKGVKGALLDLDEVEEALQRLARAGLIQDRREPRYGKDAKVVNLVEVVGDDR